MAVDVVTVVAVDDEGAIPTVVAVVVVVVVAALGLVEAIGVSLFLVTVPLDEGGGIAK